MRNFGLRTPISAVLTLTVAGLAIAPSAMASPAPADPAALAIAAQSAANSANQAFIDRDWDAVTSFADDFDASYSALGFQRDAASDAADAAQDANDAAQDELDDAQKEHRVAQKARNKAKSAADDADDAIRPAQVARNKARKDADDARAAVTTAEGLAIEAEAPILAAQGELDQAILDAGSANDNFNAPVASVIGAPAWWTAINDRPLTISQLFGAHDDAVANVASQQSAYDVAIAAIAEAQRQLDEASGFVAKLLARFNLASVRAQNFETTSRYGIAVAVRDGIDRALTETGGYALKDALDAANGVVDDKEDALQDARDAKQDADDAVANAIEDRDTKIAFQAEMAQALKDAQQLAKDTEAARVEAAAALKAAKVIVDQKRIALEGLGSDLGVKRAALEGLNALVTGLDTSRGDVEDRRADLVDLQTVMAETKVSIPGHNGTVHPGDTVELPFSITNSQLFDLSEARVEVTAPLGLVANCDILASGVVAAAATVNCTVGYKVTAADLFADEVSVTVVLSGYIPLGPGNPRARVASRTLVSVSATTTFKVAALAVVETPDDAVSEPTPAAVTIDVADDDAEPVAVTTAAELSETGSDAFGSVTDAAVLLFIGLGLVVISRRRFMHQK